jgi:hypothetical protein
LGHPNISLVHDIPSLKVLFLKGCKTREQAEAYQAMPGFLCRYTVDHISWQYHMLNPQRLENPDDLELLKRLIAKTAKELAARAAA